MRRFALCATLLGLCAACGAAASGARARPASRTFQFRYHTVVKEIRTLLSRLNLPAHRYNGHSFRKGGAQSLADAQVHRDIIQAMGRWSSDCYKLYITTPIEDVTSASLALEPTRGCGTQETA